MQISDDRGRSISEATLRLSEDEITELLVAASDLEQEGAAHSIIRSGDGTTLAVYRDTGDAGPLQRSTDWWVGPLVLIAAILMVVGAYTIGRGVVDLLF